MKAAVYTQYGLPEVVHTADVPTPNLGDNQVLVRVMYTAVTAADVRIRSATFPKGFGVLARLVFGITKPRNPVLGSCFSGVVDAVGANVHDLARGDEVCGMSGATMGAHAEYIVVDAKKSLAAKPESVSHKDAAAMLFGGTAALYFLRDQLKVHAGDTVLVNGASGAVGTNAVQLARYFGATVTGVTSGRKIDKILELGASHCIDYTKTNVIEGDERYDIVLDTVGTIHATSGKKILTQRGHLALMVASLGEILLSLFDARVKTGTASEKKTDIEFLLELMHRGLLRAVIDSEYTLDTIAEAHTRASSGHKTGNVVVEIGE